MPSPRSPRRAAPLAQTAALVATLVATLVAAATATAAPTTAAVEGVLLSAGGSPAADGSYKMTLSLYNAASGGAAVWSEGPVDVSVVGGRFHHRLGVAKALDAATLAGLTTPHLGVSVGADPELPRRPLDAAPYAVLAGSAQAIACTACITANHIAGGAVAAASVGFTYAGSNTKGGPALDLACTGCVSVGELTFDADVDLGGNSLKGKNATFSGDIVAKTVTATALVGDGSKITGLALPAGNCKAGEAMVGIAADGKLVCKSIAAALPADGLNEVSNELLSNQFQDVIAAKTQGVAIPDNTGAEAVSELTFPDIGVAQTFAIKVEVKNSDLSTVSLQLLPPDDKKVGYILCDPCGAQLQKAVTLELPKTAPKSGDLSTWVGSNPKGSWTLKAKDVGFCVTQTDPQGNCDLQAKTDGKIVDWSIAIQTLSNQKVQVAGRLLVAGGLTLQTTEKAALICDASRVGTLYWDGGAIQVCTAAGLFPIAVGLPGSEANPGVTCADIRAKVATSKNGTYWVDADGFGGKPAFQVYCDMETAGGGWTKVSEYAETFYANVSNRSEIAYKEVLILEYDHGVSPPLLKTAVTQQTCYNSPKKGFHTTSHGSAHCDTGIQVRIGGTGGSCGDEENGCFGIYKGDTVFGGATGCNWNCSSGAVTIWGKGYNCNSCRCRNTPQTTTAGCGNAGAWGALRHWILVR